MTRKAYAVNDLLLSTVIENYLLQNEMVGETYSRIDEVLNEQFGRLLENCFTPEKLYSVEAYEENNPLLIYVLAYCEHLKNYLESKSEIITFDFLVSDNKIDVRFYINTQSQRVVFDIANKNVDLINVTNLALVAIARNIAKYIFFKKSGFPRFSSKEANQLADFYSYKAQTFFMSGEVGLNSELRIAYDEKLVKFSRNVMGTLDSVVSNSSYHLERPEININGLKSRIYKKSILAGQSVNKWLNETLFQKEVKVRKLLRNSIVRGDSTLTVADHLIREFHLTRVQARTFARTIMQEVNNQIYANFIKQNSKYFDYELFVAVLDSRTTPECRFLDGRKYKLGKAPRPPLHFNCRSMLIPLVDEEKGGEREFDVSIESNIFKSFKRVYGVSKKSVSDLSYDEMKKYIEYKNNETRDLIGSIPLRVNYDTWFRNQTPSFQNRVLGKRKGDLYRKGLVSITGERL